ncbi:MAG: C40 family peptidase [Paracoccus sp. (in: a-proteobacteria)]|nr:C40 family peptidase [Paracoccus sp. (in: a-proteobacteria)]
MDRRLTPATDRVALESLRDQMDRPAYTAGRPARLAVPLTDLLTAPDGRRDRQVVFGTDLTVIDERDGFAFIQSGLDGYCGWVHAASLTGDLPAITHRVTAPATHIYPVANMKQPERMSLTRGSRLSVTTIADGFAELAGGGFVPAPHIGDRPCTDPAQVAETLLGTPYLWGGNSRSGIDCSGLAQLALSECGIACPGDSDLQRDAFPVTDTIQRGDLLFWPGHVAVALSSNMMIHATAWQMAVIRESIPDAIARIDAADDGPFQGARRPM